MSDSSWYDPLPEQPVPSVPARDKVELAVTLLLLTGLLGLLWFGVAREGPGIPDPIASTPARPQPAYARTAAPSVVNSRPPVTTTWSDAAR